MIANAHMNIHYTLKFVPGGNWHLVAITSFVVYCVYIITVKVSNKCL